MARTVGGHAHGLCALLHRGALSEQELGAAADSGCALLAYRLTTPDKCLVPGYAFPMALAHVIVSA